MKTTKYITTLLLLITSFLTYGQNSIKGLSDNCEKNDYAILEVRLNMEDEFRTLEGRDTEGLSRVAVYMGNNTDKEILSKGFQGYNQVVNYLNEMRENGWVLEDTYSIKGSALILTHYVFRKKK